MASTSGLTLDLRKFDLILGAGFRVDAYDTGGAVLAWQGDFSTVAQGADDNNVLVIVGSTYAIITISNMMSANVIAYVSAWVNSRTPRPLAIKDRNGLTDLAAARAMPRQQAGMTWTNTHTPTTIDIHCPNLTGTLGGLLDV